MGVATPKKRGRRVSDNNEHQHANNSSNMEDKLMK